MRGQALLVAGAMALSAFAPMSASAKSPDYGYQNGYQDSYQGGYQGGYQGSDYQSEQDCLKKKRDRMVAGGALGAIAGAVLGSNVAGRGAKSEGGVLGAVAGAVAGGAIARSTAKCDAYSGGYGPYTQDGAGYHGDPNYDDYGLKGGPYAPASYSYDSSYGRQCGWGEQILRDPNGRSIRESIYMCKGRDGAWRIQSR
jgi:hypothetical protein